MVDGARLLALRVRVSGSYRRRLVRGSPRQSSGFSPGRGDILETAVRLPVPFFSEWPRRRRQAWRPRRSALVATGPPIHWDRRLQSSRRETGWTSDVWRAQPVGAPVLFARRESSRVTRPCRSRSQVVACPFASVSSSLAGPYPCRRPCHARQLPTRVVGIRRRLAAQTTRRL
jgi:hypothetical protein